MHRMFRISVDGRSYTVVVEELSDDGLAASAVSAPVSTGARAPAAPVRAPAPSAARVPMARPAPRAPAAAPRPAAGGGGGGEVVAPLAGVVQSIEVKVGDAIQDGDVVAIIEAMKMHTEVVSKVSGTVQAIAIGAQDRVETGQVILTVG